MSDTRNEAEQELVNVGMASSMEDVLGSALGSSFNMPPPAPRAKESQSVMAAVASAEEETSPLADEPSKDEPVPGMAEWKDTYEAYVEEWQAESAIAREKALSTRLRIEKEREDEIKAIEDKKKAEKKEQARKEKEVRDQQKLRQELEGKKASPSKDHHGSKEDRERKVKEAWELVKGAPEPAEGHEVTTDARGVTPQDVQGGQAIAQGGSRPHIKQTAYDPTTSTEPLPPSMQDSPPPSYPHPTDSATLSRHSATSQAWEEISGSPSSNEEVSAGTSGTSGSNDDIVKIPRRSTGAQQPSQGPPAAPPSLTLSLFTAPSHLTFSRVIAVLGINMVLPFVNGVMLGFGEIFAREVVKVGKIWWKEGGNFISLFTGRRDQGRSGAGRGVAGVGLSGSGGFP